MTTKTKPTADIELGEWAPAPSVLAKVPETEKEMLAAAEKAITALHAAVVADDRSAARECDSLMRAIRWRLNGETELGCAAGEDSPAQLIASHTAATPGHVPMWGQKGEFLVVHEGMRVWVSVNSIANASWPHFELQVVDLDGQFVSETGYNSAHTQAPAWGKTVKDAALDVIASKKRKRLTMEHYEKLRDRELPDWMTALDPPPSTLPPPNVDKDRPKAADVLGEAAVSLDNPGLPEVKIPTARIDAEVTPGKVKAVKSSTRRSDAMIFLAPERLTIMDDFNVRVESPEYLKRVRQLADDMKENGFRIDKPISCFVAKAGDDNRVVIQDGHTRYKAAKLAISEGADLGDLPVVLLPATTSMDDLIDGLVTTNNGAPLTQLETAIVVKRRLNRGASVPEIARKLRMTSTAVENLMILAAAPRSLQEMVAANQVAGTVVIDLINSIGAERAVKQLSEQLAKAQASGKNRITAKNIPAMQFKQAVKRNAPKLFEAVSAVKADPGYNSLAPETREQIEAMTAELERLRKEAG